MKNIKISPCIKLAVLILFLGLLLSPSAFSVTLDSKKDSVTGSVIKVDDDGDGDFIKIQEAIDNSTPGDIIEVYSGTYIDENVTLNKQLTLKGIDSELGGGTGTGKPLIVGVIDSQPEMGLITILAAYCSISGFHLKGKENCYCKAGVEALTENNDIFQNDIENVNFGILLNIDASTNRLYENNLPGTFYAIVSYSNDNEIFENDATDNGYGILVSYPAIHNNVYRNTVINSNDIGIQTSRSNNNIIFENTVINCPRGIVCYNEGEGFEMVVYKNNVAECGQGIWCSGSRHRIYQNNITDCDEGITYSGTFYDDNIVIFENTIYSCGSGISVDAIEDSEIYKNIIFSCGTGVKTSNAYFCNISKNMLTENDNGIVLGGSGYNQIFNNNISYNNEYGLLVSNSNENTIYHNNFIENQMNVYSDCSLLYPWEDYNIWDLGYKKGGCGNYWSDYTGNDKKGDGVGDTPYIIPDVYPNPLTNDLDRYPLMKPDSNPTYKTYTFIKLFIVLLEKLFERFPLFEKLLFNVL